jgi:UDP-N-acetylglucosamine diphosphorylase/glucosamine-1-phosphate N-acetyltransferase
MEANIILFDDWRRENLLPLTFTRPVADLRVGILTIKEKWERALNSPCYFLTQKYLSEKFELPMQNGACILINGGVLPSSELVKAIQNLGINEALVTENSIIAGRISSLPNVGYIPVLADFVKLQTYSNEIVEIVHPWHIFSLNGAEINRDFNLLTANRKSQPLSSTNTLLNAENVFVEEGAIVECAILNGNTGPIYIGKNAEIMEGSIVRGPFALCDHSTLKIGAKIYGPTTIGPHSKVGGEVNNCVIYGCTNKAHDGFIGNSVIGEWCNLGADTNTSNLKNNYAQVKLWSYPKHSFIDTGLQFCGLVMGDHSKCGINTMFNTGTVVGVSANIFGDGFPRNFIPSFSWGGAQGFTTYKIDKALETAEIVMGRRGIPLSDIDKEILTKIYNQSEGLHK